MNKKLLIHKCQDCDNLISFKAIRCKSCNMKMLWKSNSLNTSHRKERLPLISGDKYNYLTIIKFHHSLFKYGRNNFYYLCKCDCGKEKIILKDSIKNEDTQSCGCKHFISNGKSHRKNKFEASARAIYGLLKERSKRYNRKVDITFEEFYNISQLECYYCGISPQQFFKTHDNKCYGTFIYNGIDRIDSCKGYIIGNVVPCCKRCNIAKNDMSIEDFLNHINRIYEHNKK